MKRLLMTVVLIAGMGAIAFADVEMNFSVHGEYTKYNKFKQDGEEVSDMVFKTNAGSYGFLFGFSPYFLTPASFLDIGLAFNADVSIVPATRMTASVPLILSSKADVTVESGGAIMWGAEAGPTLRFNFGESSSLAIAALARANWSSYIFGNPKVTIGNTTYSSSEAKMKWFGFDFDVVLSVAYKIWFVTYTESSVGLNIEASYGMPLLGSLSYNLDSIDRFSFDDLSGKYNIAGGMRGKVYVGVSYCIGRRGIYK